MARVLVVDDSADVSFLLGRVLEGAGHETEETASGEEALLRLGREPAPDCLVLDIQMPGITGWDVLEHLRDASPRPRVVVCSVKASAADQARAARLGAAAWVTKPFDIDHLLRTVSGVLARG